MSSAVRQAPSVILPSNIQFEDKTPVEPKVGRFWSILLYPLKVIGASNSVS